MKNYARIDSGVVFELLKTAGDITRMFHPDLVWVAVPDDVSVAVGWTALQEGDTWVFSEPIVPVRTIEELTSLIASERFQREGQGIVVNGMGIDTSRDSQSLIAGTAVSALMDPVYVCNFKTVSGFVELAASGILEVATAVRAHVQACFDRELTLLRAIEMGSYSDDMLTQGWPDSLPSPEPEPAPVEPQ
jgi:hypothetical protein